MALSILGLSSQLTSDVPLEVPADYGFGRDAVASNTSDYTPYASSADDSQSYSNSFWQVLTKRTTTTPPPPPPIEPAPIQFPNGPTLVNFNENSDSVGRHYYILTQAGVLDAVSLAISAFRGVDAYPDSFARYFPPADACSVKAVFQQLYSPHAGPASAVFSDYKIYYETSSDISQLAMTNRDCSINMLGNSPSKMTPSADDPGALRGYCVLCPLLFQWSPGRLADVGGCNALDPYTSLKMDAAGSTILHEWLHWTRLFKPIVGLAIIDFYPPIGWSPPNGYGVYNSWLLNRNYPSRTLFNADSYMWFAMESYWRQMCPNWVPIDPPAGAPSLPAPALVPGGPIP